MEYFAKSPLLRLDSISCWLSGFIFLRPTYSNVSLLPPFSRKIVHSLSRPWQRVKTHVSTSVANQCWRRRSTWQPLPNAWGRERNPSSCQRGEERTPLISGTSSVCPRRAAEKSSLEKSSPQKSSQQNCPTRRKAHRLFDGCGEKLTYEAKNRAFTQVKYVHSTEVCWMPYAHAVILHFTSRIPF